MDKRLVVAYAQGGLRAINNDFLGTEYLFQLMKCTKIECGDGCTTVSMLKVTKLYTLIE